MLRLSIVSRPKFFISWWRFLKSRLFKLRLCHVDICIEITLINRDNQDFLRQSRLLRFCQELLRYLNIIKTFWGIQVQKSRQIEKSSSGKLIKSTHFWSRSRQTIKIYQKFHVSMDFLISIETFGTGRWCLNKIKTSRSGMRSLDCQDKIFLSVEIFSIVEISFLKVSRLRLSVETQLRYDRDTIETNQDPQP